MTERTERDEKLLNIYQYLIGVINIQSYLLKTLAEIMNFSNKNIQELINKYGDNFMQESVEYLAKEFDWDIYFEKKEEPKSE